MKAIIKSRQIYEEHVDDLEEVHDCKIEFLEDGFELCYDGGKVKVEKNILYVIRESSFLKVEVEKENVSSLNTPYGDIEIKVCGKSLKWEDKPFSLNVEYKVALGGTLEYINELQILVMEE